MKPAIRREDLGGEFLIRERCWITETWQDGGDPAVSVARARVEPGVTTQLHAPDGVAERYLVVDGVGIMEVGALEPAEVAKGDLVPGSPPSR